MVSFFVLLTEKYPAPWAREPVQWVGRLLCTQATCIPPLAIHVGSSQALSGVIAENRARRPAPLPPFKNPHAFPLMLQEGGPAP